MRLRASHPVAAPREAVIARLCDVDALLAELGPGGAGLTRLDAPAPAGVGSVWQGQVGINGVVRPLEARLTAMDRPESLRIEAAAGGIGLDARFRLDPLPGHGTELSLEADLRPLSLKGRVAVQSLRLLHGNLTRRLQDRLARLARHLEETA